MTAIIATVAPVLIAGCATKGALRKAVEEQRNALAVERTERMAGDSANQQDIVAVRNDIQSLRNDLQTLRNEFGAKITAVEAGMQFAMPVNFAFDDATVRQQDERGLGQFAHVAQRYYSGSLITVEGFADPAGSVGYNLDLSRRRAEAVKSYLITQGVAPTLVKTVGYGKSRLVVPGAWGNQLGAESNRRVVFVVETKAQTPVALLDQRENR
jgi:peptidoglycan-associated lipoprotein